MILMIISESNNKNKFMPFAHTGSPYYRRFHFHSHCCSLSIQQPLVDLFLSERSFVFYGLPAPEFPRTRTRRERTGKAISRKWRAQYTGRRAVQFRISNWYLRSRQKVRRYGATKVRSVVGECATYVSLVLVITKFTQ